MKILNKAIIIIFSVLFLTACGEETSESKKKSSLYTILSDKKDEETEQRVLQILTVDGLKQPDVEEITEEIMKHYENKKLDSLHIYFHTVNESEPLSNVKAHSYVAYTEEGANQVGVDAANTYKIEAK